MLSAKDAFVYIILFVYRYKAVLYTKRKGKSTDCNLALFVMDFQRAKSEPEKDQKQLKTSCI